MLARGTLSLIIVTTFCIVTSHLQADISLPKIFSDHMVLQRDSNVSVWGTAEPQQKLVIGFDGKETNIQAGPDGRWVTSVKTGGPGGPFELSIAAIDSETKVVFSNVMVGEVWICAGGFNMEFPVSKALNPETEIEQAKNFPNIRLFSVKQSASPKLLRDFVGVNPWTVCTPETVKDFSAVGYFFGRELSRKLGDVPIGLMDISTIDATPCEAWMSMEALESEAEFAPLLKHWLEKEDPTSESHPANLYHSMIAPVTRFPIRGTIWYQGEANVGRGSQYARLLPVLIKDWREKFGGKEAPFYFVQLAPHRYVDQATEALPEVWDAQMQTFKTVNNVGMAVAVDVGNAKELRPKNKQVIGQRLALWALADNYLAEIPAEEKDFLFSGPIYESMATIDDKIRLTFSHTGDKLSASQSDEPLYNFEVCGEDKKFYPALAKVVDDVVVEVTSPDVENPIAVRFAWKDDCKPNLVNQGGLPAAPFRTDEFPLSSDGKHFAF